MECSKGCGRQFNINVIAKHEKVCEKVFQSKRKAFNSAAHRQLDVEGFKAPPPPPVWE
ncbi:MAG: C2HC-type zinc finger protein [Bdellovibrionales bacterium]|nr:C2HC-type zinc finger protein [Bdellovibrionales bacterium]